MTIQTTVPTPPTFGAVCARCNGTYQTPLWRAPHNVMCPACLYGIASFRFS